MIGWLARQDDLFWIAFCLCCVAWLTVPILLVLLITPLMLVALWLLGRRGAP